MITVGIDLAAEPAKTGVAQLEWTSTGASLVELALGATDETLEAAIAGSDKTGIDCPLGWPIVFIEFISRHRDDRVGLLSDVAGAEWRKALANRMTDLHVKQKLPVIQGLSVATDRIGLTAMRCAALLAKLAGDGPRMSRVGDGPVAEVYPAASLVAWGITHNGYKKPKASPQLSALVNELLDGREWLDLGDFQHLCRTSDDAFDALVAALI